MQLTELGVISTPCSTLPAEGLLPKRSASGRDARGAARAVRVTASQALLDLAVAGGHDAVFVHHGLFWKGDDGRVTGFRRRACAPCSPTTSACSPTICRSTCIRSSATTRNSRA